MTSLPLRLFVLLMVASAAIIAACISQPPQDPSLTPVRVAHQALVSNGPLYIAREEGYFARQGIDVEFVKTQGGTATLPLLVNGDVAAAGATLKSGYVNAIVKGAHIRIVADRGSIAPGYCDVASFVVRKDLADKGIVRNVSDLKGRKIAARDSDFDYLQSLARGNLTPDDVDTVNMDFATAVIALQNGAVDAGLLSEPYVTEAVNSGSAVVLMPGHEFIPNWTAPLFYGPAFLDKNPELGKQFMVAYLQGVRQYNEGKTERNLDILQNYTGLDRDLLRQSCWPPVADDGTVPRQFNREYIDWMFANHSISQKLGDDQLYDMSYAEYADSVLNNMSPQNRQ